jgi:uncharacterized RDD family membrane protein YckC
VTEHQENQTSYGGFWRRLGAYFLDAIIVMPLAGIVFLLDRFRMFQLYYFLPSVLFGLWFHVYLVKRYGATPGKLIVGLRIQKTDGSSVDYQAAFLRYVILCVLSAALSIAIIIGALGMSDSDYETLGFLQRSQVLRNSAGSFYVYVTWMLNIWVWSEFFVMLTNKQRRSLHDFMAGTVVVHLKK